ncbi:putative methylase [Klebsiella phage vB_KaeS_Diencephalon]|nr:putative methylase [Klebsiella phage vB_KaeS_Diencephalon]
MKKAIFLFNRTRIMLKPWMDAGYECWTFDGQHPEGVTTTPDGIKQVGMWFHANRTAIQAHEVAKLVGGNVAFIASFAECTFLTTSGARWLYHPDDKHLAVEDRRPHPLYPNRKKDMADAIKLAKFVELVAACCQLMDGPYKSIPWMLENPATNFLNKRWRRPDHVFNPCDYGGYLPANTPHPYYPEFYPNSDAYTKKTGIWCGNGFVMPEKKPVEPVPGDFNKVTRQGGKSKNVKNVRSATPPGFARAVFEANHHE